MWVVKQTSQLSVTEIYLFFSKGEVAFLFVFRICILFLLHPIDYTLVVQYQLVQG